MNEPVSSQSRAASPADLIASVEESFTPSSPATRRELFAGRATALQQLLDLSRQPGRHAVIFGERHTGKTSLATIVPEFASDPLGLVCVRAEAGDTFDSLWRKMAMSVRDVLRRAERGLATPAFPADTPALLAGTGTVATGDVLRFLARLAASSPAWVVFDDFELVDDAPTRAQMRAVAGATGASAPGITLVFVGAAPSCGALLDASPSLVPFPVPRLSPDESIEAVMRALRQLGRVAADVVVERIATLSNGLPHVAQALARGAARAASDAGRGPVGSEHLDFAVRAEIDHAPDSVREAYEQATVRARRGIYPEILLACALSPRDASGTFSVADVCATVTRIVRREVRGLTNQVSALTEEGRGSVLDKQGAAKHARYRFVDPALEPHILMRGLADGWATYQAPSWLPGLEATEMQKAA